MTMNDDIEMIFFKQLNIFILFLQYSYMSLCQPKKKEFSTWKSLNMKITINNDMFAIIQIHLLLNNLHTRCE
jgi:hypothetical protein